MKRRAVAVDDGDFVADPGQAVRQRRADSAASHHHYTHASVLPAVARCQIVANLRTRNATAYGTLGRAWAYSWHSCPSFRPSRAGWFWEGRSAATRWATRCCPSGSRLPVFASDALSSVAYAPEEIFLVLSVAGLSAYTMAPWIGLAVAVVMLVVIASYRQNVHAYPSGGGDYEVVTTNLGGDGGPDGGERAAGGLRADRGGVDGVGDVQHRLGGAVHRPAQGVVRGRRRSCFSPSMNLRGIRESGTAFAIPTYAFMIGMFIMIGWGLFRIFVLGDPLQAESAEFHHASRARRRARLRPGVPGGPVVLVGLCGADRCRGHQQRRARVPETQVAERGDHAAAARRHRGVAVHGHHRAGQEDRRARSSTTRRPNSSGAPAGYHQKTLVAQLADAVFGSFPVGFMLIAVVTALILVLAANTAFNGFPVLGSILAQDRYLPRQLHTRGDRLAFSNGILFLAFAAIAFVVAFRAEVTALIQLYIVGVFVSFTLSQIGMVRHWTRLSAHRDRRRRSAARCSARGSSTPSASCAPARCSSWSCCHQIPRRARGSRSWRWARCSSS